jgi:hypothetical protein
MLGTKLNIPATAAVRMTELVSKAGRKEKDTDVLMWVSTEKDKPSGELKAQLRGVGTTSFFQKARNAFLARSAASKENIENLFMQRGMTREEASSALANVAKIGKNYSAKSVNEALQTFDNARREQVQKTGVSPNTKASIVTNDAINGSKLSIEVTLGRLSDDYLPDYDPRTKNTL